MELRGTTILAVRHKGHVALIGDGQVTTTAVLCSCLSGI